MGSLLSVVFIAGLATIGVAVGLRPTVADGRIVAGDMLEQLGGRGITGIDCAREIPIGVRGAVFECAVTADDGSTARIEYTMNREGAYSARVVDSTAPTHAPPRREPGGDPWQ